jgi:hypothetical protein
MELVIIGECESGKKVSERKNRISSGRLAVATIPNSAD